VRTSGVAPAALTVAMATAISVGPSGSSGCDDCERRTSTPGPTHRIEITNPREEKAKKKLDPLARMILPSSLEDSSDTKRSVDYEEN
jgi:hypothetical protein